MFILIATITMITGEPALPIQLSAKAESYKTYHECQDEVGSILSKLKFEADLAGHNTTVNTVAGNAVHVIVENTQRKEFAHINYTCAQEGL